MEAELENFWRKCDDMTVAIDEAMNTAAVHFVIGDEIN
jgi:hypothetical protein